MGRIQKKICFTGVYAYFVIGGSQDREHGEDSHFRDRNGLKNTFQAMNCTGVPKKMMGDVDENS